LLSFVTHTSAGRLLLRAAVIFVRPAASLTGKHAFGTDNISIAHSAPPHQHLERCPHRWAGAARQRGDRHCVNLALQPPPCCQSLRHFQVRAGTAAVAARAHDRRTAPSTARRRCWRRRHRSRLAPGLLLPLLLLLLLLLLLAEVLTHRLPLVLPTPFPPPGSIVLPLHRGAQLPDLALVCRACQPQLRAQRCRLRADGVQPQSRCVRARPARSLRTLQRVQRFVAHAGCRLIRRARRKGQRGILLSAPLPPPPLPHLALRALLLLAPLRRHLHSSEHSIPLLLLARGHLDAQRAERAGLVAHALQQLVALGAQHRRGSGGSGSGRRQRWHWRRCGSRWRCRACVALRARTTFCRLRVQVPPRSSRHRRWQMSPLPPMLVL